MTTKNENDSKNRRLEFFKYRGHNSKCIDYFYILDVSKTINVLTLAVVGQGNILIKAILVIQANFHFFAAVFCKITSAS